MARQVAPRKIVGLGETRGIQALMGLRAELGIAPRERVCPVITGLPKLHDGQAQVLAEAARFNVLCCGRRFGKTVLLEYIGINAAMQGKPAGWFAPNYKYLTEAFRDVSSHLQRTDVRARQHPEFRIDVLSTGGSFEFWSTDDPDAGRSRKYAVALVDEAAKVKNLNSAWNGAILPTLADLKGSAWFASTPRGMDFFEQAFGYGQDTSRPDWKSWQMPTASNPHIDASEVEMMQAEMPERFYRQEVLAEFIDEAGGVFRNIRESIDVGRSEPEEPMSGRTYILGVDLARTHDFTVLSVVGSDGRQVYHERFNQISWERIYASIARVARMYNATVWLDSTGAGDPPFERLRLMGLRVHGFTFTNSSKEQLIDALAMALEGGKIRLMDLPEQTNELRAFQYELTAARNVRMNAPEGMHDDCVIALALSWWPLPMTKKVVHRFF